MGEGGGVEGDTAKKVHERAPEKKRAEEVGGVPGVVLMVEGCCGLYHRELAAP